MRGTPHTDFPFIPKEEGVPSDVLPVQLFEMQTWNRDICGSAGGNGLAPWRVLGW